MNEQEARTLKELFAKYLKLYKQKDVSVSDKEWLEQLFKSELPEVKEEEVKHDVEKIMDAIEEFDGNLRSVNEAAQKGVSKESCIAVKMQRQQ